MRIDFRGRKRLALAGATCVAVGALAVGLSSNRLTGMFFGPKIGCGPPPAEAGAPEVVHVATRDGSLLEGWLFSGRRAPGEPAQAVIVQAHGNGWNLEKQWKFAWRLSQHGFDVLAFDYRGFGNSAGSVTRRSAIDDIDAALDWAHARWPKTPEVLLGQSMGGALSVEVGAHRHDVAAIVLDSPFSSWAEVAADSLVESGWARRSLGVALSPLLRGSGRDPLDLIKKIDVPVLIVSGSKDEVCPPAMARDLASASGCRLLEIEGARHVGQRTPEQSDVAEDAIVQFVEEAVARSAR